MIRENFKKVGFFNLVLIGLVLVYDVIRLFDNASVIGRAAILVHILGYVAGLLYAFSGYKKDSAKYYMLFMFMLLISEVMSILNLTSRSEANIVSYILRVACILIAFMLTFGKNLGLKTTLSICSVSLLIHIYNLVRVIINAKDKFQAATNSVSDLVLIVIALVFILAKYEDKAVRGSK